MTHLLDSSAWLAHLFGLPGVEQVNSLFDDPRITVHLSVLSIPEVYARLNSLGQPEHWEEVWTTYSALFSKVLPVDEAVAHQAVRLRAATPQRLPTIDSLIAATAAIHPVSYTHLWPRRWPSWM